MKTTQSLFLLLVVIVSSCKQQDDYTKIQTNYSVEKNISEVQLPSQDSYLFADIDQSIKDTVLLKLKKDFASLSSFLTFVPVVTIPPVKQRKESRNDLFKISKDIVLFYEMENEELLYLYEAVYKDGSDFTKNTNPEMYKGIEEALGKEFAEQSIEFIRNKKGADRWHIRCFKKGDGIFELFEYALNYSDNKKVILIKQGYMPWVSFFKNNEFVYCRSGGVGQEIFVRSVKELIE